MLIFVIWSEPLQIDSLLAFIRALHIHLLILYNHLCKNLLSPNELSSYCPYVRLYAHAMQCNPADLETYQSLPNRSASSFTSSYAGRNTSSLPDFAFNAGLGCVSVVPPNEVYPRSYNSQYGIWRWRINYPKQRRVSFAQIKKCQSPKLRIKPIQ